MFNWPTISSRPPFHFVSRFELSTRFIKRTKFFFGALVMRVLQPTNLNTIEPVNLFHLPWSTAVNDNDDTGYGQPVRSVRSI
jgi:hypothetical protein